MRLLPANPFRKTVPLLAAVTLTLVQWGLFVHEYDQKAHPAGQQCELCLVSAHLHNAPPPAAVTAIAPVAPAIYEVALAQPVLPHAVVAGFAARAPPRLPS